MLWLNTTLAISAIEIDAFFCYLIQCTSSVFEWKNKDENFHHDFALARAQLRSSYFNQLLPIFNAIPMPILLRFSHWSCSHRGQTNQHTFSLMLLLFSILITICRLMRIEQSHRTCIVFLSHHTYELFSYFHCHFPLFYNLSRSRWK